MSRSLLAILATVTIAFVACLKQDGGDGGGLTSSEALEAINQALISTEGESFTNGIIEISTNFTIGDAVQAAAQELRAWFESQIDCSTVTIDDASVTIDFGELNDACVYNGMTYAGVTVISIESIQDGQVTVGHQWTDMTNGIVTVNGSAQVTWSASDVSRRVQHQITSTSLRGSVTATGDRTMQLINPTRTWWENGILINGSRNWTSENTEWSMAIQGVEVRAQDPVPQAGTYTLTIPDGRTLSLIFERQTDDIIRVTLTGTRQDWVFDVTRTGEVLDEAEGTGEGTGMAS
ncbi:MAG: hypothetical protein KC561_05275 [Myxococcales bacterium]|nr:hypothetical protein [Myxococcales bacterium]